VDTRLQRHDQASTRVHRTEGLEKFSLGMCLSGTSVCMLAKYDAFGRNENGAHLRVRVRPVTGPDCDRLSHDRLVVDGGHEVRRSMRYAEPGCFLANSFISTATADASHCVLIGRDLLVATPIDIATTGKAYRSPRRSVTSM
jgi:hypothetical protein